VVAGELNGPDVVSRGQFYSATVPWLVPAGSWLGGLHASHLRVDGEVRDSDSFVGGGTISYVLIADTD
jgi:hypothetical protein